MIDTWVLNNKITLKEAKEKILTEWSVEISNIPEEGTIRTRYHMDGVTRYLQRYTDSNWLTIYVERLNNMTIGKGDNWVTYDYNEDWIEG